MIEGMRWPEDNTKIGFPPLPMVPQSWRLDDRYEQEFWNKINQVEEKYYKEITPYIDKNTERVRSAQLSDEERLWFAGFVDEGTRISFDRNGKYYYPVLSRADVDSPQRAIALLRLGGNIQDHEIKAHPGENKSINWRWYARAQSAINIAQLFATDLIYKRASYEQFIKWKDNPSIEDRRQIALESTNDTANQVKNINQIHPSYIAGLFDSNGVISTTIDRGVRVPNVHMYLKIEELAQCLYGQFGGTFWTKVENRDMAIYDKTFHSETIQYIWRAQQQPALDFLAYIRPYVWLNSEMIDAVFTHV